MAGLMGSVPYQQASTLFNPQVDPFQADILKQTMSQGETAANRAKSTTMSNLANQGFGRSTFGEQLGTIAGAKAQQPYIESSINNAQQIKQQQIQNMLNFLQQGTSYDTNQELLRQQRAKQQQDWFTQLLGGVIPMAANVILPGLGTTLTAGSMFANAAGATNPSKITEPTK